MSMEINLYKECTPFQREDEIYIRYVFGRMDKKYEFIVETNSKYEPEEITWKKEPLKKDKAERRIKMLIKKLGNDDE